MEFHDLGTRRPKTTRTSLGLLEETNFDNFWCIAFLKNELRDTITFVYFKISVSVIEEYDLNFTRIIRIDDTRTDLNTIFQCETRSRCNATIHTRRKHYRDTGRQKRTVFGWDYDCINAIQIITNSATRSTSREPRFIRELFD